jgi:hypothetical protein
VRLQGVGGKTATDMLEIYNFDIAPSEYDDRPLE